jgi:6-pyruvoyl-tetrahydropterin synthase
MYTDRIVMAFYARHRLLKKDGKSEAAHGHKFQAEIIVSMDKPDQTELMEDISGIREKTSKWISEHWDNALLINDRDKELLSAANSINRGKCFVFNGENPTAPVMSKYLNEYVCGLYGGFVLSVTVWESPVQDKEYSNV